MFFAPNYYFFFLSLLKMPRCLCWWTSQKVFLLFYFSFIFFFFSFPFLLFAWSVIFIKHYHLGTGCEESKCDDSFHITTSDLERPRGNVLLSKLNIFKEQCPLATHSGAGPQILLLLRISQCSSTYVQISLQASAMSLSQNRGVLVMPFWFPPLALLKQTRMLIGKARLIKTGEAKRNWWGDREGGKKKKKR